MQQPAAKAPAGAAASGRSESSSIGAEVRKQLDLVGEQLASKVTSFRSLRHSIETIYIARCESTPDATQASVQLKANIQGRRGLCVTAHCMHIVPLSTLIPSTLGRAAFCKGRQPGMIAAGWCTCHGRPSTQHFSPLQLPTGCVVIRSATQKKPHTSIMQGIVHV